MVGHAWQAQERIREKAQGLSFTTKEDQSFCLKKKIKESLSDPKSKFRHPKDKETRTRIQIFEKKPIKITKKPKVKIKSIRKLKRNKFIKKSRKVGQLSKNAFSLPNLKSPI